jgi:hypothetical protein
MMFHHRAISRAFAVCCALAFAASACAEPGSTASGAEPDSTAATGDSVPTTDPAAEERYVGPVDQFLGFGNGKQPTEADLAQDQQDIRELEEEMATCMQALGFEYIAIEPNGEQRSRKEAFMAMPPADFAAQYGYGITTMDFEESGEVNPNDAIVEAMTIPERSAYFQALYGSMITVDENGRPVKKGGSGEAPAPGQESCAEKADIAVFGPRPEDDPRSEDSFVALRESFDVLNDSIHQDPREIAAMTAWTECMETKGHPGYTSFDAGPDEVKARADELFDGNLRSSDVDPEALSELRTFEIAVATDEYQCSIDYATVHEAVQTELEQIFIEEHRAELEQYRDAIAAGTAGKG